MVADTGRIVGKAVVVWGISALAPVFAHNPDHLS